MIAELDCASNTQQPLGASTMPANGSANSLTICELTILSPRYQGQSVITSVQVF
jgi:hypothetical protein